MSLLARYSRATFADLDSGPTVEKGLAALDSLYDLRNVIPGLISSSQLSDQDGKSETTVRGAA